MQHGFDCPCSTCAMMREMMQNDPEAREVAQEQERGYWQRQAARVAESEREEEERKRR